MKLLFVRERQVQKASVADVQHAKAILARLHIQERESFSVRNHHVAEYFGNPGMRGISGHRIVELAVLPQQAIVNYERDFEGAFGKIERIFEIVANKKQPEHAGVDVQAIDAHGVVVIPERRSFLPVGI